MRVVANIGSILNILIVATPNIVGSATCMLIAVISTILNTI